MVLVRRVRSLLAIAGLLASAWSVGSAAPAGADTPADAEVNAGPWALDAAVTPGELDADGGTLDVAISMWAATGTIDHGPDVWFAQNGATTSEAPSALASGDATAGTWVAHPVIPANATGSWDLVIGDATTTTGDTESTETMPDRLRVGFPDPPTSVDAVATGAGTHVLLSWPAAHDGGRPITAYHVIDSHGGTVATVAGDVLDADVDLADSPPDRAPLYTVVSENAVGRSLASDPSPLIPAPATVPEPPVGLVGRFGYGTAILSWQPSPHAFTSAVTSSVVTLEPGDETCSTAYLSCTETGLPDGVVYTAEVRSVNSVGASAPSRPLVLGPPGPVADFSAGVVLRSASLTWSADPNTADPATYTVTTDQAGVGCITRITSCQIDALEAGHAYTFTIRATNSMGVGPVSSPVTRTAYDFPAAPRPGAITRTDTAVTVRWSAADGQGKPVDSYVVRGTSAHNGEWVDVLPGTARSDRFTRLPTDVPFTFTVRAQNEVGEGPASGLGTAALPDPMVVPRTPLPPTAAAGSSRRITVSWRPASPGHGMSVNGYEISVLRAGRAVQNLWTGATRYSVVTKVLPAGRYEVRIRAHNHGGWSPQSRSVTVIIPR